MPDFEDGPSQEVDRYYGAKMAEPLRKESRLVQLKRRRTALAEQVVAYDEAIEALEKNPAVLNVLEKLDKIGNF